MASGSGVTTSSARIASILLPTARKASLGPLRHQCLPCLLHRRRRVNHDKQVASRTTETSVSYFEVCAYGLLWRERNTTLSCGHIFNLFCVEGLARHLRRRLFRGVIAINCLLCRGPISISTISSFEHVRVIPTCASSIFRRVRTTSSNSTLMAAFGYCYSSRRRCSSTRIASLYHSARLAAIHPRISSARSHGSRPSRRTHWL